ncbi:hypothetical protein BJY04DRAFT_201622 [Aspergillus karnatakaensis]|uniref:uncharacterized protein n=1 Tax=Aspergillus karnatakaensis TaxID=1810916 RepID=UPI003CCE06FF
MSLRFLVIPGGLVSSAFIVFSTVNHIIDCPGGRRCRSHPISFPYRLSPNSQLFTFMLLSRTGNTGF